jgi:hypothetical protein
VIPSKELHAQALSSTLFATMGGSRFLELGWRIASSLLTVAETREPMVGDGRSKMYIN